MANEKQSAANSDATTAKPATTAMEQEVLVDFCDIQSTATCGRSAFATRDIAMGSAVLTELPVLKAYFASVAIKPHLVDLARHSETIAVGDAHLLPATVTTREVGFLDAFVSSDTIVQKQVLEMQHEVDANSPMKESIRKAAYFIHSLGVFDSLDADTIERIIAVGRVNAYAFGPNQQALFARGRFVAHSCQPNCVFVAESVKGSDGEVKVYGSFRAVRDISEGELLTINYMEDDFAATSRDCRRKYLLCSKGFWCSCPLCADDSEVEDKFNQLPCPRCRPRGADGFLADSQLAGCCVLKAPGRSPPWKSQCGKAFSDEEVAIEGADALIREVLLSVQEPSAGSTAASRNEVLARTLRTLGDGHSASQALLRSGAFRAVAAVQDLESTVQKVTRCHEFLMSAGFSLGMMSMHGLYKALIARASAEVKARSPVSPAWLKLVGDAVAFAVVIEGPDSTNAQTGLVVMKLLATIAQTKRAAQQKT